MTDQQVTDLFDSSNITLGELAARSGRSLQELKDLLIPHINTPEVRKNVSN
jgi:hypothetical protein